MVDERSGTNTSPPSDSHYSGLMRRLHSILGDMQALDWAECDIQSVASAFAALESATGLLEKEVVRQAVQQLTRQLGTCASALRPPFRLHVGAGTNRLPGWINIDAPPADLSINVARGLPFAAESAEYIFCSHILEHMYYPSEATNFIADCFRTLRPRGTIRLIVPDAEQCIRAYALNDSDFYRRRVEQWPGWPTGRTRLEDTLPYLGASQDVGALYEAHRFGYDFQTISKLLRSTGFIDVIKSTYMGSAHPALRVDNASTVAGNTHGSGYFSLFVEACKP